MDAGEFRAGNRRAAPELLERFDSIFDVLQTDGQTKAASRDAEIEALIAERTQAKKAQEFRAPTRSARELLEHGVILEDTKEGVRWKRK